MKEYLIFGGAAVGIGAIIFAATRKRKKKVVIPPVIVIPSKPSVELTWPDKRPIGMVMLATYKGFTGHENYGNGDIPFGKWIVDFAYHCVKNLKYINAQGFIVWDGEGAMFDRYYTYYGDPTLIPEKVYPFFKILAQHGFKTGVCLRPDEIKWTFDQKWNREIPEHYIPQSFFENLVKKIDHARKEWGCTLFYVDSNVGKGYTPGLMNTHGAGNAIDASIFAELHKLYPDCLFIPEWANDEYRKYTMPYYHKKQPVPGNGGWVIDCADTEWTDGELLETLRKGNILMCRAWWPQEELDKIKLAYDSK